ncbi:hypothetical protein BRADI_2g45983v3 [Brachypodium distachyon]|uniref:Reverse transcriptase zinc-binding domain-containing protein n=1 Tax=Brachypodium distachyon TaxID=15368 RepID=A0A2K2DE78_BRADI|nr:hypothetical protein BRADI_2g45983v3 [Brachypodium distachyon]
MVGGRFSGLIGGCGEFSFVMRFPGLRAWSGPSGSRSVRSATHSLALGLRMWGRTWMLRLLGSFSRSGNGSRRFIWRTGWLTPWFGTGLRMGSTRLKNAYANLFAGRVCGLMASVVWYTRARVPCRFFAWLAARNRCWTVDRLARWGLPHSARCPLCDQGEETISHLLLGCVLSRQVWSRLLMLWGHGDWCPDANSNLREWWTSLPLPRRAQRDVLSAIQLVFWTIWRHRNDVVFNGTTPSVHLVISTIMDELTRWTHAGLLRGGTFLSAHGASRWLTST